MGPLAADLISADALIRACSACFLAVYVLATAAGVRLLDGRARWAAGAGCAAVLVVLGFSGAYVVVPAAIAALASRPARRRVSA